MKVEEKPQRKNIGVTQKAVVFNTAGKFLAIRRSETAPSHALEWDLPGGELEYGENPLQGIVREVLEETGLHVGELKPFDVFGHENVVGFWVTIAYSCNAFGEKIALSFEHDDFKWVTIEEFLELPAPEKIIRFVKKIFNERGK